MKIRICKNCEFWKMNLLYLGWGSVGKSTPYGACNSDKLINLGDNGGWVDKKTPIDGLGYYGRYAGLETGENFGCISFEPR